MRKLEAKVKKRRRRRNVQQATLGVIATAGVLGIALVAPNVLQVIPHLMGKEKYKVTFQAKTALGRLKAKGYIRFIEKRGKKSVEITEEGKRALALYLARETTPAKQKRRWDHRWRLVAFDIPEKRKSVRDRLRMLMRECGFLRLQNSVWIAPYDCEELVGLIKMDLRLGTSVLYAVVEELENDQWVKEHFNLV